MKKILLVLLLPFAISAQNIIDPLPIISDTTGNYDVIEREQDKFIIGWNWGSEGEKLDDAMYMNSYHGYPFGTTNVGDSMLLMQKNQLVQKL